MSDLDFPSNYKSEITTTKENNVNKYALSLISQDSNTVTLGFNSTLFNVYRGNSLSLTDQLSNTFFAFVRSIDFNTQTLTAVICHNNTTIPRIIKVEYYEWWSNKRPAASILNYIFIKESDG
jgi:hypothetical protein